MEHQRNMRDYADEKAPPPPITRNLSLSLSPSLSLSLALPLSLSLPPSLPAKSGDRNW